MICSTVMLHFYEPSVAEIQLKTPIIFAVAGKKVIFPPYQCPGAKGPRNEGLFIPPAQVEEEIILFLFVSVPYP